MMRDNRSGGGVRAPAKRPKPASPDVKLGALQGYIGFNLRIAQDASFRAFAREAHQKNHRPGRFAALMVLRDNPHITQSALGRAIARDKSSVTPLLQNLQRQGLIKRTRSTTDRRSVTLVLTALGERVLRDLILHAREHDRKLDALAGPSKAEFVAILKRIADHMV
jgi:DNA-binding MarR family transcriptional regulator